MVSGKFESSRNFFFDESLASSLVFQPRKEPDECHVVSFFTIVGRIRRFLAFEGMACSLGHHFDIKGICSTERSRKNIIILPSE